MSAKDQEGFPPHLITSSIDDKRKYFADYAVAHTVLNSVHTQLLSSILNPCGKQLIFVIGPTGAGKTFLLQWVADDLREIWRTQQETDRGRIPVVGIEAPSRDVSKPTPKDIYLRILRAVEEPLLNQKIVHGDVLMRRDDGGRILIDSKITTFRLHYAMEQALKQRHPYAMFIDEAQHLFNISGLTLPEIMDWIKSIANLTRVLIVLSGTYEMTQMLDLSDQLMRRSLILHLRRYGTSEGDQISFKSTINAFQKNIPLSEEPNLLKHWVYLYERSAGCIGILYDWLVGAHNLALNNSAKTIRLKDLEATAPLSKERAGRISENISRDEENLINLIGQDDYDQTLKNETVKIAKSKNNDLGADKKEHKKHKKVSTSRKGQVGNRKPGRDSTGRDRNVE